MMRFILFFNLMDNKKKLTATKQPSHLISSYTIVLSTTRQYLPIRF